MFSGIHSLLFGKKHHKHKSEDSADDRSQVSTDTDFVILERRHSDEYDRNSALYPNLDPAHPSTSNLPYAISPSLPNLTDATLKPETKEETKVDMLFGVPFVLSSQLLLLEDDPNKKFGGIIRSLENFKDLEQNMFEDFNYDFELEHTVSSEFSDA